MSKLISLLLAGFLAFSPVFAKPVAKTSGTQGYIILYDEKCPTTGADDIFYFKAFNNKNELAFDGCWQDLGSQIILANLKNGNVILADKDAFEAITNV